MKTNFQDSIIYKNALKQYQEDIYANILKPIHSIVINNDEVYLFYNQKIIDDVFNQMKDIYKNNEDGEESDFPEGLGYQEPILKRVVFMGNEYKVIMLWYDNCDLPDCFETKI